MPTTEEFAQIKNLKIYEILIFSFLACQISVLNIFTYYIFVKILSPTDAPPPPMAPILAISFAIIAPAGQRERLGVDTTLKT